MIGGFILGMITGGALVWLYGPEIREYVNDRTQAARSRAAETLGAAAHGLDAARERIEGGIGGPGEGRP